MFIARFIPVLGLVPTLVAAGPNEQWAQVVYVAPVYEMVRHVEPREECYETRSHRRRGQSATPPLLGAIIGAAIGNAVGHNKTNKRVGAVAGALLGGSIGADIGRGHSGGYRKEMRCEVVEEIHEEERLSGYDVRYEYNGQTYATRMHRHPGDRIRVRVRVTPVP